MSLLEVPFELVRAMPGSERVRESLASLAFRNLGDGPDEAFEDLFRRDPGDPGLFGPGSAAWHLHADVPPLFVGGVAALMLQTLNPVVMAGVADHSHYKDDPLGRLERTGTFVAATTYGSRNVAQQAIDAVGRVHQRVVGITPDGRPYAASDPDAITWVHATEHAMFLAAHQRHGRRPFGPDRADAYLDEVAEIAIRLGATWAPRSVDELDAYFRRVRPELYAGAQARETLRFLELGGFGGRSAEASAYRIIAAAAKALLPSWARRMCGFQLPPVVGPLTRRLAVDPATDVFLTTSRWLMGRSLPSVLAHERVGLAAAA
jgi:uncharacterized protein (DUF2236 family)